jgi:hypothetical protein
VLELSDLEAGAIGLDDEGRDSVRVAGVGIGDGEADVEVGDAEVRDPVLGPVDHPLVPVAHGAGSHPAGVGAGVGLREGEGRSPLPARTARQEARLLLVGPEELDRQRPELLDHQH